MERGELGSVDDEYGAKSINLRVGEIRSLREDCLAGIWSCDADNGTSANS